MRHIRNTVRKEVKKILIQLGAKPTLRGFYYWPVAVNYAKMRGIMNYKMCADVYTYVADTFNTSPSKVERCMRTITDGCQRKIKKYFNYTGNRITNKDFLALILENLEEGGESEC